MARTQQSRPPPQPEALRMRKTHTRMAGAVAALLAAGLAGFSLRSAPRSSASLAARAPSAAVTTQVIRRTIHIVRHERARSRSGVRPGSVPARSGAAVSTARSIHTGASGSLHPGSSGTVVSAGGVVTTRTSPSHASAPTASGSAGAPVTTRTSPSHAATSSGPAPTSSPVTTRTSPHGSSGASGTKHVTTRSSGNDGGDHGD
jgi:hypothetical protein